MDYSRKTWPVRMLCCIHMNPIHFKRAYGRELVCQKHLKRKLGTPKLLGHLLDEPHQLRSGVLSISQLTVGWQIDQALPGFACLRM